MNKKNNLNFSFRLHPSYCEFNGDEKKEFEVFKIGEKEFFVVWEEDEEKIGVIHTNTDVIENIISGAWIIE